MLPWLVLIVAVISAETSIFDWGGLENRRVGVTVGLGVGAGLGVGVGIAVGTWVFVCVGVGVA